MTQNVKFSLRIKSDDALLTGGDWFDSKALTNVQTRRTSKTAWTKGVARKNTKIKVALPEERPVKLIILNDHSLETSAQYRICASNTAIIDSDDISFDSSDNSINSLTSSLAGYAVDDVTTVMDSQLNDRTFTVATEGTNKLLVTEPVTDENAVINEPIKLVANMLYDSGKEEAHPFTFSIDVLNISDDNFILGRFLPEERDSNPKDIVLQLDSTVNATYWDIDFFDESNVNVMVTDADISFDAATKTITSLGGGFDNFADGQTISVAGSVSNNRHLTATSVTSNSIVVAENILDELAGNEVTIATGRIELGRLFMATEFQPERNFDYGMDIILDDLSLTNRTLNGKTKHRQRTKQRGISLVLSNMTQNEALSFMLELQRSVGLTGEIAVIPFPDKPSLQKLNFIGELIKLERIKVTNSGRWKCKVTIMERL